MVVQLHCPDQVRRDDNKGDVNDDVHSSSCDPERKLFQGKTLESRLWAVDMVLPLGCICLSKSPMDVASHIEIQCQP